MHVYFIYIYNYIYRYANTCMPWLFGTQPLSFCVFCLRFCNPPSVTLSDRTLGHEVTTRGLECLSLKLRHGPMSQLRSTGFMRSSWGSLWKINMATSVWCFARSTVLLNVVLSNFISYSIYCACYVYFIISIYIVYTMFIHLSVLFILYIYTYSCFILFILYEYYVWFILYRCHHFILLSY